MTILIGIDIGALLLGIYCNCIVNRYPVLDKVGYDEHGLPIVFPEDRPPIPKVKPPKIDRTNPPRPVLRTQWNEE